DGLADDREAEPVTVLGIPGVVGNLEVLVEDPALIGRSDSDSVVAHLDHEARTGPANADQHPRTPIRGRELQRIAGEVGQSVPEPMLVAHRKLPTRAWPTNDQPCATPRRLGRVHALEAVEHAAEVDRRDGDGRAAIAQAAEFRK